MSSLHSINTSTNNWKELPSFSDFMANADRKQSRIRKATMDISFMAHNLATTGMAREQAPWLHALKNRTYRKYVQHLGLDDGECREFEMPEISATNGELSHRELMAACDDFGRPLIVRGWFAGCEATRTWTLDGLTEHAGSVEIACVLSESTKFNQDRVTMTVREYCDRVRRGELLYLSGEMNLLRDDNPLLDHLELHRMSKETRDVLNTSRMYVFGGRSRGTGTAMHCGEYASVFVAVCGKKRWRMLRPDYTAMMNPIISRFYSRLILADGNGDCNRIDDFDAFWSQFRFLPHYVGDIGEGDLIVVPGWWWHHVENLGEEVTLGVDLDTIFRRPSDSRLLTLAARTDLSPLRRFLSPHEKNRLRGQGLFS